jgi:hypothetical protein
LWWRRWTVKGREVSIERVVVVSAEIGRWRDKAAEMGLIRLRKWRECVRKIWRVRSEC